MYVCMYICMYVCMYVCMHVCIYACMDIYICVQMYICMYMYICEHAYFWDEQKGEERRTPGCRLAVGRLRVLKPFPTARPSPASPQPSLHPPSPCCCRQPHLKRGDVDTRAETTPACAHPNPTTPAGLCVVSGCAQAGPQAQEKTRRLGGLHCRLCRRKSPAVVPTLRVGAHAEPDNRTLSSNPTGSVFPSCTGRELRLTHVAFTAAQLAGRGASNAASLAQIDALGIVPGPADHFVHTSPLLCISNIQKEFTAADR